MLPSHTAGLQLLQRDPGRGAPLCDHLPPPAPRQRAARASMFDQLEGRRAGAAARAPAAFRVGGAGRCRIRVRSSRAFPASPPGRRDGSTRSCTAPAARNYASARAPPRSPGAHRRRCRELRLREDRFDDHSRSAAGSCVCGAGQHHALPGRRVGGRRQGRFCRRAAPRRRRLEARPKRRGQGDVPRPAGHGRSDLPGCSQLSAGSPLVESGLWVDGVELLEKGGGLTATKGTIYGAPSTRTRARQAPRCRLRAHRVRWHGGRAGLSRQVSAPQVPAVSGAVSRNG